MMNILKYIAELVPPRPREQKEPQNLFELNYNCYYQDTTSAYLVKTSLSKYLKTHTWIPKAKKKYLPAHREKITRTEDVIHWIHKHLGRYLDVCILDNRASRYRWIVDKELLRQIRCGMWVLPWRDTRLTQLMRRFRYQKVDLSESTSFTIYQSQDGFAPFYRGSTIYSNFILKKNLKSGMGSDGVYLVEGKTTFHTSRYVLKFASNVEEFQQEIAALHQTRDWPHSPRLIWVDKAKKALITTYCGQELRSVSEFKRDAFRKQVQSLLCELKTKYKLFHNDVRWKNIVILNGHLTLIDWGRANNQPSDQDPQNLVPLSCQKPIDS